MVGDQPAILFHNQQNNGYEKTLLSPFDLMDGVIQSLRPEYRYQFHGGYTRSFSDA
jgi:hypothetical protein